MVKSKEIKVGAVYGRVSVDESAEVEHGSLEQQQHMGREFAEGLSATTGVSHVVKYNLIEERGVSGKNTNRPKYQELLSLVQSKNIDFVIAKEISRISRSTKDFCDFLTLCKENSVTVHIRGMAADPSSPMGEMIFKIFAMIAEFERQQIVERTKSSIRSAMRNNAKINGGPTPLGFDRDPKRKGVWIPNQKELKIVESIMHKFNERGSYVEVVKDLKSLGIKSKTAKDFRRCSLKRLLTNRKYIGKMSVPNDTGEEIWVDLPFGEVIDRQLFEEVQHNVKKIEGQKGINKNRSRIYILSSLLEFEDGSPFLGQSGTGRAGKVHYYYYNKKQKLSLEALKLESSIFNSLRVFEDNQKMIGYANDLRKDTYSKLSFVSNEIQKRHSEMKTTEKEESELMKNFKSMEKKGSSRVMEWLDSQLLEIENKKMQIGESLVVLAKEKEALEGAFLDAKSLKTSLKAVFDRLDKAAPDVQRGIARQLFKKIKVYKGNKIEIQWNVPHLPCVPGGQGFVKDNQWGGRWGSNPRQPESQSGALPTELRPPLIS